MGGRFGESCGHFGLLFVFSTLLHTINDPILFRMRVLGGGGGGLALCNVSPIAQRPHYLADYSPPTGLVLASTGSRVASLRNVSIRGKCHDRDTC